MRGKVIIIGAMGVVALATLTVNAQNASSKTASKGSVATLLAATTRVAAEREQVSIAEREKSEPAAATTTPKPEEKTETETKATAPKAALSAGCQAAIASLKDLHKADVAEDAQERAAAEANPTTAKSGDQAEDAAEVQKWKTALMQARAACVPQPTTACQTAIAGLQTTLSGLHTDELGELESRTGIDVLADLGAVRTAFSAVRTACPERTE